MIVQLEFNSVCSKIYKLSWKFARFVKQMSHVAIVYHDVVDKAMSISRPHCLFYVSYRRQGEQV